MRRIVLALLILLQATLCHAQGLMTLGAGSVAPSVPPYIGPVATGAMILEDHLSFGASSQMEACSRHIARTNITDMQVGVPTWYTAHANGAETANGGAITANLVLEYPVGTVAATFTWSGNSNPTLPDNSNNLSDLISVTIPSGGVFMLHVFESSASGWVLNNAGDIGSGVPGSFARDVANGEKYRQAASGLTMQATCSAITSSDSNTGNQGWRPAAIFGHTTKPTPFILGDSRAMGYADFFNDGSTDTGYARTVGPSFGYINAGIFGLTTSLYISSHTLKNQLAAYCTHIIFELGQNDIGTGGSLSTFLTNQQTIFGYFPGKTIFATTISPFTTSTDAFLTPGNQTIGSSGGHTSVVSYNTSLRSGSIAGLAGFFDFDSIAEGGLSNAGKWNAGPTPISGVYTATQSAGVINVSAMTSGAIALQDNLGSTASIGTPRISSFGTGTGQAGTYNSTGSATVSSGTTYISNPPVGPDGTHEFTKMLGLYLTGGAVNPALIHYP